ncbi:MAG: HEAT repeat domain-containing protein [Phycisphaeraceae bacterium]|nr:HEAT repeat domain-containing protein [Phycisphaeraceae bacterium]
MSRDGGKRVWMIAGAAGLLGIAAGCAGPYQAPLARRSVEKDREPTVERDPTDAHRERVERQERDISRTPPTQRDPATIVQMRERALMLLSAAAGGATPEERVNALEALTLAPGRLNAVVGQSLTDPNPGVRGVAAMAVGRARLRSASGLVQPLLSDPSPLVRSAAIYALLRCEQPVDATPLAEMLMDSDPLVRAQAAFVLGELGEPSALGPLRDAARRSLPRASPAAVRLMDLQIAEARIKLGDDTALVDIRTALFPARPEDLEAVALAAQIAGQVGDRSSIDRLVFLTAEWDRDRRPMPAEIRLAAAASLAKLGRRQGSFIADIYRKNEQDTLRAHAAMVYGETGWPENLDVLNEMMQDPSGRVRVAAAAGIVKIAAQTGLAADGQ